jgi:hypothetical protein
LVAVAVVVAVAAGEPSSGGQWRSGSSASNSVASSGSSGSEFTMNRSV